ncbi:uncharacterized protein LOC105380177 [Plutella xylostella]|uniref:uncharacterized protein LOC105380177 n=1 Tax=Plutella xylostella TaxID=51655 RepID=UPI002032831B|nr:uncharacterized protein LOC105380177 [Plutella xylostella]
MKDYLVLRRACEKIYYAGGGDFWFEEGTIGNDNHILYKAYTLSIFSMCIVMTVLEILAVFAGDFPDDEHSDAVTFALSHTMVLAKMSSVVARKRVVRALCRDAARVCAAHEDPQLMATKARIIRMNVAAYFACVYGSCVFYIFEGLRKLYFDGTHFVTIVTYWPSFSDNSASATAFRIICTLVLNLMMLPMIAFDSLAVTFLIIIKYKFITLRQFFERLEGEFCDVASRESLEAATELFERRVKEGIGMHQELLRITKELDKSFGILIALSVCLSFVSDISLLLSLTLAEQLPFTTSLKIILFITALLFLLAEFLCNAGEITYQASLLSDALFHCGWQQLGGSGRGRRAARLLVPAAAAAQRPVVMKAFSMLQLTYATFLTVVRSMYSVFALISSRKKDH